MITVVMFGTSVIDTAYRRLLKPYLFAMDPEAAHRLALRMLAAAPPFPRRPGRAELAVKLWGIEFQNPVGLAAGMDKDGVAIQGWESLGFAFAEIGTVTPKAQPGNDPPRLWRLRDKKALINKLGFPSEGMDAVAERIAKTRKRPHSIRLAVNFGPNKDTPPDAVAADYAALMAKFNGLADFVVVNVSSPNTPGLRNWQSPEKMREIFAAIRAPGAADRKPVPVLVKIAPDLDRNDLFQICETALELGLDGIVATNSTVARQAVGVTSSREGGLSGEPLKIRARELIRDIYLHTRGRIPIVGVGGISSAEDAWLAIRAGASLVELYTGLIYEGPALVDKINSGLMDLLRRGKFRSISDAVGIDR
ncbi:MAG TPA: quinone-dependent dihydroorotate dehydrogenase [Candidatus Acidoferrales bacterium]|nr:quinone-dependent dihydroorotate dehydrogenase [Candidatus Acidoferrales bacterium]